MHIKDQKFSRFCRNGSFSGILTSFIFGLIHLISFANGHWQANLGVKRIAYKLCLSDLYLMNQTPCQLKWNKTEDSISNSVSSAHGSEKNTILKWRSNAIKVDAMGIFSCACSSIGHKFGLSVCLSIHYQRVSVYYKRVYVGLQGRSV